MGKIVNINENDLKRIVKRVLNERQQLNEIAPLVLWGIGAGVALIGGSIGLTWWNGSTASSAVKQLFDGCRSGEIGKPEMSKAQHADIASRINTAIEGVGTDEDGLADALAEIKSVPDVCEVLKSYKSQGFGDMYDEIDGDIDGGEWEKYVRIPLSNAINYTKEKNEKAAKGNDTTDGTKSGGGNSKDYSGVSGEGSVSELQQILKDKGLDIGSTGVDGKFGPATLKATLKALRGS